MAGIALAIHALVSLILLSSAVAHCLPRTSHHQVGSNPHSHTGHHEHTSHAPAIPDSADHQDECCGVLCRAAGGHAPAPASDPTRVVPLSYAVQAAPLSDERPVFNGRRCLLPLGSRAPPIAA